MLGFFFVVVIIVCATADDGAIPATTTYTEEERDLLAVFFTLAKVLYWTGFFDESARCLSLCDDC